ncbi:MAG: CinA family nicotinamide mononucleotide deamidase-related protein [Anaerolineales bacterium]|nr:CinA family nicotinamide mononucleotide deamidase-related protein [Anaerolineales bacterium]
MPVAEIITIGTELLLGEILDTNAQYLARALREIGIDLYRKSTVGDNPKRIAEAIQQALSRADIVLMTGGLGPTVDDPTREAVALALGVSLEFHPELWEQVQARFKRYERQPTENNKRQAMLPAGATAIENPVGTAPAFLYELQEKVIIALPGVPREMEHLLQNQVLPYLMAHYHPGVVILSRIVHTAGIGESQIDDLIGDLEGMDNPTVGLAAHSGQVDIRITAKAASTQAADQLILPVIGRLQERLGAWIYGLDKESLEVVAMRRLAEKGWRLVVVEAGTQAALIRRLASFKEQLASGHVLGSLPSEERLSELLHAYCREQQAEVGMGVVVYPGSEKQDARFLLLTPAGMQRFARPYGGPPQSAPRWAVNASLDILRNL